MSSRCAEMFVSSHCYRNSKICRYSPTIDLPDGPGGPGIPIRPLSPLRPCGPGDPGSPTWPRRHKVVIGHQRRRIVKELIDWCIDPYRCTWCLPPGGCLEARDLPFRPENTQNTTALSLLRSFCLHDTNQIIGFTASSNRTSTSVNGRKVSVLVFTADLALLARGWPRSGEVCSCAVEIRRPRSWTDNCSKCRTSRISESFSRWMNFSDADAAPVCGPFYFWLTSCAFCPRYLLHTFSEPSLALCRGVLQCSVLLVPWFLVFSWDGWEALLLSTVT